MHFVKDLDDLSSWPVQGFFAVFCSGLFISRLLLLTLLSHTPSLQRVIPRRSSSQECFSFSTQMDLIDELRTHLQKLSSPKCQTHPFGWNVTSLWNRFGQTWLINSQGPNPKFLRIFKFTKKSWARENRKKWIYLKSQSIFEFRNFSLKNSWEYLI